MLKINIRNLILFTLPILLLTSCVNKIGFYPYNFASKDKVHNDVCKTCKVVLPTLDKKIDRTFYNFKKMNL